MNLKKAKYFLAYWKNNWRGFLLRWSKHTESQIVICGLPRSGTSLLFNMLAASVVDYKPYVGMTKHSREGSFKDVLNIEGSFISKQPSDVFKIENLHLYNLSGKKVYFIVTVRDLRDLILSRHQNLPKERYIDFEGRWDPFNRVYRKVGIKKFSRAIDSVLNFDNVLLVRYEDIVLDSEKVQKRIEEKFGITFKINMGEYYKEKDKLIYSDKFDQAHDKEVAFRNEDKGLRMQSLEKWKKNENKDFVKAQFTKYPEMNELLVKYGYTHDESWISKL